MGKKLYQTLMDDTPLVLDDGQELCLSCCDCGLVHIVTWQYVDEHLVMYFKRDNRRTGQVRRHKRRKGEMPK